MAGDIIRGHSGTATLVGGRLVAHVRKVLAAIDVEALTDRERLELVAELEKTKHTAAATQARATHAVRRSREAASPQDAVRSVGSEVALARRESPTLGDRFVGLARALVTEMPCTMRELEAGSCSERQAVAMVQATSVLSLEDRTEVDRRVGPLLARLGLRGTESAARRVAAELDAAAIVRRMEAAAASRRVSVRPAPDGMAYLTVLGPLSEVVGAHAALRARAQSVAGGLAPDEAPEGRGLGAIAADTALRLLSGRAVGQTQPVEVHLVMTDRSLLGTGDPDRSTSEPGRIPGHGSVPAPVARAAVRGAGSAWLRRLYTGPDGRDLVAMDSRRRTFSGQLRRMLMLRDDVCRTPWCEAPIAHADHATPVHAGGATTFDEGNGRCERCNYGKEAPGWRIIRRSASQLGSGSRRPPPTAHELEVRTPSGLRYTSLAPPLLGWGSESGVRSGDPSTHDEAIEVVTPNAANPGASHEPRWSDGTRQVRQPARGNADTSSAHGARTHDGKRGPTSSTPEGSSHSTSGGVAGCGSSRSATRSRAEVLKAAGITVLRRPRPRARSLLLELGQYRT